MKKQILLAVLALAATELTVYGFSAAVAADTIVATDAAAFTPTIGKMVYSADGKKLAAIYKIDPTGAPQLLLEGKLVTIPAATMKEVDGKIETSLTKKDVFTRG